MRLHTIDTMDSGRSHGTWRNTDRTVGRLPCACDLRQRNMFGQWSRSWAAGWRRYRQNEQLPGRVGTANFVSATKSGAVPMALFAVKRHGKDTMLVVEAATAHAAEGWLVFRSADGQPLALLRVEEVLHLETVTPGARGTARRVWRVDV